MELIEIAGLLLIVMMLLLAGGVWIAMTLAIVGWIGMAFFTGTPPGKNLFTAFWGSSASWTLAALPMFIWMGEILFRTKLSEEMFEGLSNISSESLVRKRISPIQMNIGSAAS